MLWTVLVVILLVGGSYYGAVQRLKPSHVEAPEGELYADDAVPEEPALGLPG